MIILAYFFILGGIVLSKAIKINKSYLFILLILIVSFSTSSGLISQYSGNPNSILFNSPQKINDTSYIYDTEAYAAEWFKNYHNQGNIFSDTPGSDRLVSMGMIPYSNISTDWLKVNKTLGNGYLYLDYANIIGKKFNFWTTSWNTNNMSEEQNKYENKNLIYSSGESEIWYS